MSEAKAVARFSREFYERDAIAYCKTLPLEHFMESEAQSMQRRITLAALDVVARERTDVHLYNELLIQYPIDELPFFARVCPDNFVVVHKGALLTGTSYMIEHQPVAPFLVIEYVSKSSENKDNEDNYLIYEREVRVPYYLVCHPEEEEILLFKLRRKNLEYTTVKPSADGRYAIPELELELVMHDGWLRYLFRGEFMEMPSDYYKQNKKLKTELDLERQQRLTAEAEIEQLKAMLAASRGTQA